MLLMQEMKRDRRTLERLWTKTKLVIHENIYHKPRIRVDEHIDFIKRAYYNDTIVQFSAGQPLSS